MPFKHALVWKCSYCAAEVIQQGPRAAALPPVPPEGWHSVSVKKLIPAHKTPEGHKMGDQVDDQRRSVCPACRDLLKNILETGAYA